MAPSSFLTAIICVAQLSSPVSASNQSTVDMIPNNLDKRLESLNDNIRDLQAFSTLNNIISEIVLILPDSDVSSNGLDLTVTELICYEANVQDIRVTQSSASESMKRVAINVIGLSVTCNFRWTYQLNALSVFNGSGSGKALLDSSSGALINLNITSALPSRDVRVEGCKANVQIGDFVLDGDGLGSVASIINVFKKLLMGMIEEEINTVFCSQVSELGSALLFVVQSNEEHAIPFEAYINSTSSSGVSWLILFILLVIGYSVSCCFCGICCAARMRSRVLLQGTPAKDVVAEGVPTEEVDSSQVTAPESNQIDIEDQGLIHFKGGADLL
ncbi:hypothetical protein ACHAW6_013739 [Cyclotella cf. meneghiniana]